ncbi:2'-5' RNA ligase family protein [Paenibacillus lupini]|uniref:2'-5' RNA ligase family protein n=1 Tax=Paenibacillus lupini TaxID=1450204 RepID=UPI00141E1F3E|nr:2'-5' RNA ligase family protein [Paenibacillus lupini]NIK21713.1 2'-5' RNA ligase [Paenibacillus lupini]
MEFFIGIVPPEDYKQQISVFRNKWSNTFRNRWDVNGFREHVEPHITIKAKSGLTKDMNWHKKVRETCSSFPIFQLTLSEPATFGTALTFLSVESNEIYSLHKNLVEAVSPPPELIERHIELDHFIPHLTLGQTKWGMNEAEIIEMKLAAREALSPYPSFDVTFVRVFDIKTNAPFEDIKLAKFF